MPTDPVNYAKLFGPPSACECKECRTIYSPAAYFVDTLMFLKEGERKILFDDGNGQREVVLNDGGQNRQLLRRPDLGEIELSCRNTNVVLPYLDLVNEVLERAVSGSLPATGEEKSLWPQTTGTASDLAVAPEHLDAKAYEVLRQAIYSWALPFDLWAEQARAFLGLLGIRRHELMRQLRGKITVNLAAGGSESWAFPSDGAIAGEALGLTPAERRIITTGSLEVRAATTGSLSELKGKLTIDGIALVDGDQVLVKDQAGGAQPWNGVFIVRENAWQRSPPADEMLFLNGASVQVREGSQANTRWIAKVPNPKSGSLDLSSVSFSRYTGSALDASGGKPWEHWSGSALSDDAWKRLKADLTTNVGVFLDRSGLTYAELVELLETRFASPDRTNPFRVQFSKDDNDRCDVTKAVFEPALNDAVLQRIHRFVRLRRKLGWTTRDLDRAVRALGAKDLTDDLLIHLAEVRRLCDELNLPLVEALSYWGNIDSLSDADGKPSFYDQLFQNKTVVGDAMPAFALNSDHSDLAHAGQIPKLTDYVPALLAGLRISTGELTLLLGDLATQHLTLANLSALYRRVSLARALRLPVAEFLKLKTLAGFDPFSPQAPAEVWHFVEAARKVQSSGFGIAGLDYLLCDAGPLAPSDSSIFVALTDIQSGLTKIKGKGPLQGDQAAEEFIQQKLASNLGIGGIKTSLLGDFLSEDFRDHAVPAGQAAPAQRAYRLLAKIAYVVKTLRLTPDRLGTRDAPAWLFERGPKLGWLDTNPGRPAFASWARMIDFFSVWRSLPPQRTSLFDLLDQTEGARDSAARAKWIADLSERTQWPRKDLELLLMATPGAAPSASAGPALLGLSWPEDFRDGSLLSRLAGIFEMLGRAGIGVAQAASWSSPDVTSETASAICQAAKARYQAEAWPAVAKPLQDALREKRRDALVAYLTSHVNKFKDANDIYEWFLVDPQMSPKMLTSRLKQAISSVQLFIQRALLNLEPGVFEDASAPQNPRAREWATWRKSHQFWGAALKVFLYPENYAEPEVRDNKTPFFKALENELLQREVTLESAEEAFRGYLDKLAEVARLEIAGFYNEGGTYHVFGRTFETPHVHFYRRWDDHGWSAWERVDLDIQGDHLVPVVWNSRLYLFWPIFHKKPTKTDGSSNTTHLEIQLAWSEYRNGKWLPKKMTAASREKSLVADFQDDDGDRHSQYVIKAFTGPLATSAISGKRLNDGELEIAFFHWLPFKQGDSENQLTFINGAIWDVGHFLFSATEGEPICSGEDWKRAKPPSYPKDTEHQFNSWQTRKQQSLALPENKIPASLVVGNVTANSRITPPHQYPDFLGKDSFFFEDSSHSFFARYLHQTIEHIARSHEVSFQDVILTRALPFDGIPAPGPLHFSDPLSLSDFESRNSLGLEGGGTR